jgi:HSP20 family protein
LTLAGGHPMTRPKATGAPMSDRSGGLDMTMIRRNREELAPQTGLRDEMNRLFDTFFQGAIPPNEWRTTFLPSIDVHETAQEIVVTAELPGVKPEDVDVNLTGNILTIKGEKKEEMDTKETKGKSWHRVERTYGSFQRTFQLPDSVDPERAKASYDHGVLKVAIAKTEAAKPRSIKVDIAK